MKKLIGIAFLVLSMLLLAVSVKANGINGITIEIDVKPLSCPQSINPNSMGRTPVAIVTTGSFDAAVVDPVTVVFADAYPLRWAWEDYDGDGDIDIVLYFKTQECNLPTHPGSHQVFLEGYTTGGFHFWDYDWVNIVPKGPK